jgi:threonine synthase
MLPPLNPIYSPSNAFPPLVELATVGLSQCAGTLFAKLECATPTGNHKHRLAEAAVARFRTGAWTSITAASCGHLANSLAHVCTSQRIPCTLFVPRGCPVPIPRSEWVHVDASCASYEDTVAASARRAAADSILNATPGPGPLSEDYLQSLAAISGEILQQAGVPPELIFCPVGNGTTLAGIHRGFTTAVPHAVPRHYGVSTSGNILTSSAPSTRIVDWDMEPLHALKPLNRSEVEAAVHDSGGEWVCVSSADARDAQRELIRGEGLAVHPAAAAALAGWKTIVARNPGLRAKRAVVVLTALSGEAP